MVHLAAVPNDSDVTVPISEELESIKLDDAFHDEFTTSVYGSRFAGEDLPKYEMPEKEMPREVAYRMIKDDLSLDGNPMLNLASFVTTYMEDEAEKLMMEAFPKNFIDYEEYPQSADIQNRCVSMIGRLFNADTGDDTKSAVGTSCVGSSEAIILSTLAMKKRWQNRRKAEGKPYDKPNIIMSSAVQVCWEKAARYLDVEERFVYCTDTRYIIDPDETVDLVDENTIGICTILGSTYTGQYEDVKGVNDRLVKKNLDCPIHVDAASGGFVAPFVHPDLVWDFRLEKVVYPGVGWVLWRSPEFLPQELVFNINYLGAEQSSFTLNFSKGASQVIGQYYQLIRLGKRGYRAIMMYGNVAFNQMVQKLTLCRNLTKTADYLAAALQQVGFIVLSEGGGRGLPLVAFRLNPKDHHRYDEVSHLPSKITRSYLYTDFDQFAVAHQLRERGWVVPAYTMAPNTKNFKLMRVVVREDFSRSRCDQLVCDIVFALKTLNEMDEKNIAEHAVRAFRSSRRVQKEKHDTPSYKGETHSLQGQTGKTHAVC
ncbi:MAG: hypothetical protein M1833_007254 [Piccolia ochrophora]|nr:MAG: hypothetical protein M1833_007254 [Piccolia ochrophora]